MPKKWFCFYFFSYFPKCYEHIFSYQIIFNMNLCIRSHLTDHVAPHLNAGNVDESSVNVEIEFFDQSLSPFYGMNGFSVSLLNDVNLEPCLEHF